MTALGKGLFQLAAAGLACGLILSLCGKGSRREVLRFGCACVTVVVLLTLLRGAELPWGSLEGYQAQLQLEIDRAQAENRQAVLEQTRLSLAEELERQGAAMGLHCKIEVRCAADREGRVTVEQVLITCLTENREALSRLKQTAAAQLGIGEEQVLILEEGVE